MAASSCRACCYWGYRSGPYLHLCAPGCFPAASGAAAQVQGRPQRPAPHRGGAETHQTVSFLTARLPGACMGHDTWRVRPGQWWRSVAEWGTCTPTAADYRGQVLAEKGSAKGCEGLRCQDGGMGSLAYVWVALGWCASRSPQLCKEGIGREGCCLRCGCRKFWSEWHPGG